MKNSLYSIKNEYQYESDSSTTVNNYINNRLLCQIEWYDTKSAIYQDHYKKLTITSTILSSCIPIFTLALDFECSIFFKFLIAIISAAVSVISSILSLNKYKELWVQYRTNCEILKSILHRYYTHTGEFNFNDDLENFKNLVSSCENYFTKEFNNWNNTYSEKSHSSKKS